MGKLIKLNTLTPISVQKRLLPELFRHAMDAFGQDTLKIAWEEFCDDTEPYPEDEAHEMFEVFKHWYLFNWNLDEPLSMTHRAPMSKTVSESYLKERKNLISVQDKTLIEALNRRPYSLYQIRRIDTGHSFEFADLLLAKSKLVQASPDLKHLKEGDIVLGKLTMPINDETYCCSLGPITLPPELKLEAAVFSTKILDFTNRKILTEKLLTSMDIFVIGFYLDVVDGLAGGDPSSSIDERAILNEVNARMSPTLEENSAKLSLSDTNYYEFKVELKGTKPKLWRKFQMKKSLSFAHLHEAIQDACGWENCHLYSFMTEGRSAEEIAGPNGDDGYPANKLKLVEYFEDFKKCVYIYDFGDDWIHTISCKPIKLEEKFRRRLIGGEGSFPLEDCGGIYGYEQCKAILAGEIEDDDERLDWIGSWRPDGFSLKETQQQFDKK